LPRPLPSVIMFSPVFRGDPARSAGP
jgi:hypothetical protein